MPVDTSLMVPVAAAIALGIAFFAFPFIALWLMFREIERFFHRRRNSR